MPISHADSQRLCLEQNGGMPRLLEIMRRLRDPKTGCPWDIEQTFETIAPYTIEEAYEVADAISQGDWPELESELGDLLLQVVYHAEIGSERNVFDFQSIADAISNKMINRHPHVFGAESRDKSAKQQTRDWEKIKAAERAEKSGVAVRTLDGVALGLPALMRAIKLQKRAARVGFDWPSTINVLDKIAEETAELVEAAAESDMDHMAEEFGDLLFVMVNLGRHLGLDAETNLRQANQKFIRRFNMVEDALHANGSDPAHSNLAEMDMLWDAAKAAENR